MMKRLVITITLLLTMVAIPASAATWRGYATVRSNGGWYASASTTARNVEDIQLGIYTYGTGRTVDWDGSWFCYNSDFGATSSRSKSGSVTTSANKWKWVSLRSSSVRKYECDFDGAAAPRSSSSIKIKLRVR